MLAMAKHGGSMEMDGNFDGGSHDECRTIWRNPRSIAVSSRAPPAQKISTQLLTLAGRSTDQLAALAVAPCLFGAVAGRESLWKLGGDSTLPGICRNVALLAPSSQASECWNLCACQA